MLLLILLFSSSSAQFSGEESTPAKLLRPRDFNHHAYLAYQDKNVEPTKQGPVLFPNDAPPPPRPPLIVTSRPLIESIARSELNPTPPAITNNSIAEATQVKPEFRLRPEYLRERRPEFSSPDSGSFFRLKPALLAKLQGYKPFLVSTPDYGLYAKKGGDGESYQDYDEPPPTLPPIYKAIADHAQQKVLKLLQKPNQEPLKYQKKEPVYPRYQHNDVRNDVDYDHDHDSNYAFSYTVKDHKTGDDFSHSQHSIGSATNGEYRVRLPDGRMQIVSYTADKNGYKADVRYDDEDKTAGNSINHNHYDKHDYEGNRHDYEGNRHDYPPNGHDYGGNRHDYPLNGHDYGLNRHSYPAIKHDYGPYKQDYSANSLPYAPVSQTYAANEREYDRTNYDYVPNKNYVTKPPPVKENYNEYSDTSKEYYNTDYSLEYDGKDENYAPHRSKFSSFVPKSSKLGTIVVPAVENLNFISSTVKPSYEELKPLFVTKNLYSVQPTQNYLKNVEINVPSTTPPSIYDGTTEHVVVIGRTKPHLYTNIRNLPVTPSPVAVTSPSTFVTPSSYLVSTISSLKNGQVPVLSGRFIDKINKYLTFT